MRWLMMLKLNKMKKMVKLIISTRDGSIRLGLLLAGFNPLINYENIDYENGGSYLNQIEVDDHIIYLECKNYGLLKVASYVVL